jgi:hypothetical protein
MRSKDKKHGKENERLRQEKTEIRKDLEDGSRGKDLSYLNEMPQMGGYEGVKAGVPPPKEKSDKEDNIEDES